MHVTKVDKRTRISEFTVNQEFLDSNGIVVLSLADDTLNFFKVRWVSTSASFDVFEEDLWVFSLG